MKCRVCPSYMEKLYSFYSPFYDHIFGHLLSPGRRQSFKYLNPKPNQKILEIGVGPGSTLEFYPPHTELVGIDISAAMIEKAREKAQKLNSGSKFEFHVMDAANLEFPDNNFDVVMAAYVITTVQDPHRVCREMLRVAKPGGQIIIVNHSKDPDRFLAKLENLTSPFFSRIGFVTDLDVVSLVRSTEIEIQQVVNCNFLNLHKIILGQKPLHLL